jgi:hypothetical protein
MKKLFISLFFSIAFCGILLGQQTPLTPDLVIKGGYFNFDINQLFTEKIEETVNYKISKEDLLTNIATFIFLNKYEIILQKEERFVFYCKNISVGTDYVSTPIGVFSRSKSEISFMITIDVLDSLYKYTITDIKTDRRVERVDAEYIALAPNIDFERLKDAGFNVSTVTIAGIDLPTKGGINSVHRKRVAGMIAERNGYVNLCIKEGKTVNKLKNKWVEKITHMDSVLHSEIQLYKDEYNSVLETVKEMNIRISEN